MTSLSSIATVPTSSLPLTTTFTAPAACWDTPWVVLDVPTTWWKQGGDNVPSCFPPAFPFSNSRIIYSPGICPAGWTSACDRVFTTEQTTQLIVSCCPISYECASTSRDVHDWEDQFGCASPYTANKEGWGVQSNAAQVNSMYQLPVMIVEATATSRSVLSVTSTSPVPASTSDRGSGPTSSSVATPGNERHGGLSEGVLVGTVLGCVVGVAAISLLGYFAWSSRRRQHAKSIELQPSFPRSLPHYASVYRNHLPHYQHGPVEMDDTGVTPIYELK